MFWGYNLHATEDETEIEVRELGRIQRKGKFWTQVPDQDLSFQQLCYDVI